MTPLSPFNLAQTFTAAGTGKAIQLNGLGHVGLHDRAQHYKLDYRGRDRIDAFYGLFVVLCLYVTKEK